MAGQFIQSARFKDFDDFASKVRSWDLDFVQLDKGPFFCDLLHFGTGRVQIGRFSLNRHLIQRGSPPSNYSTLGIPESDTPHRVWRSKTLTPNEITVLNAGEELDSVSYPGFKIYAFSFSEKWFNEFADQVCIADAVDQLKKMNHVRSTPPKMEKVRRLLRRICRELENNPHSLGNPRLRSELEDELPRRILDVLVPTEDLSFPEKIRYRNVLMKRAEDYINESAHEILTVGDLCKAIGARERTLRYAFKERFGVSPKEYLQALRLNCVRREISRNSSDFRGISDIANSWGFWHMGKFAADYRRLFGELPSETLRRSSFDAGG